jgi:UDP-glucose 4-epimerase
LVAGSGSIKRDLDWQPQFPSLESIVRSAWDWRRAHPDGYTS